jgi:phenylacetate-CoA ligase
VEVRPDAAGATSAADRGAEAAGLEQRIKSYVGTTVKVLVVELGRLERSAGKARRVIDRRPPLV